MAFRIENLSALARGIDRLARLADEQSRLIERATVTVFRRLPPQAKRDIGGQYALSSREIGKRLHAKIDRTSVTLRGTGRPLTLIKFKAKQTATGVTAQIEKGKFVSIPHAFIRIPAGAPGAGPQVMLRDAAYSHDSIPSNVLDIALVGRNKHGYPILLLGGPSVADMLRDPGREDRLSDFVQAKFAAEVDRLAEIARGR